MRGHDFHATLLTHNLDSKIAFMLGNVQVNHRFPHHQSADPKLPDEVRKTWVIEFYELVSGVNLKAQACAQQ